MIVKLFTEGHIGSGAMDALIFSGKISGPIKPYFMCEMLGNSATQIYFMGLFILCWEFHHALTNG